MTSSAAVLRFAAEFATLLVAVAGVAVALLRPRLLGIGARSRMALALGFLGLAVAAFLHGSLLFEAGDVPVAVVRAGGIVLLAIGTLGWGEDRATQRILWAALVLMAAAETAALMGSTAVADGGRAVAAMGLAAVLLSSARRSVPARVAVSAGAALLVVVLAVSVALSVVLSDDIAREALRRVEARADAEAEAILGLRDTATASANLIAFSLQGSSIDRLQQLSRAPMFDPVIDDDIRLLAEAGLLPSKGPVLYLTDQKKLIVQRGIDRAGAETLVGSRVVDRAAAELSAASGVEVVAGGRALVVGVRAIAPTVGGQRRLLGLVVATVALDDGYLGPRVGNDRNLSLALVDRDRKLAGVGSLLPAATTRVGRDALGPSGQASSISGGAFLAGRALPSISGTPVLALVASTPTSVVEDTRSSLFRTLFLVALATSLAAFAAALLVGERIGGGLRRLTVAAGRIQRGDFGARVDIATQDEVGVLASTLNSMAGSIQTLTTELRQNRDEEAALRGRLEAVVGGMGEAVVAVDPAGRITTFNRAAQELFGVVVGQAVARPIGEVASVATEDGTDLTPRLARPEAARWGEAAVVHRRDGVDVPVALSAGGLPGADGRVGGGVYVLRDMRREREADRAKNDLLANISHELRTPLVPIKGYALMLRRGRLPAADTRDAIERISDAADQLERLIQRLLEVAAGDRRADLRLEPVAVRPVVESVLRRWKARDGGRHRMTQRVARGLPSIRADRASLEEALDELVDNAVKFSPAGSRVQVGALAARTSDGRDAVELFVADQGRGMTEEQANRMFEDFAQADTSATRDVGGLGLGLPIVRSVVEAHAGELSWESEPGRGSRFSIVLPVDPQSDQKP